jgi:serine/threonine protein kinase, bacterial
MQLAEGHIFAGYSIVRPLGTGGMGEVYLVQHPRLPRRDALKLLRADVSADPEFRARFIREADLASTLWHPNIVGIHDRGETDGQLWIAMDYVDGSNAAESLAQRYPAGMPVDRVIAIVSAVASALDYAHRQGLLHRDIKPANIMLTQPDGNHDRRIMLSDFGIARTMGEISGLTSTNSTIGTVAYCAPEQLMGEDIDGRADQYALAATAYHLLTGTLLFGQSNPAVVISKHLGTAPPTLAKTHPQLSALDPVLAIGLAKDRDGRFSTSTELADALTAAAKGVAHDPFAPTRPAPIPPSPKAMVTSSPAGGRRVGPVAGGATVAIAVVAAGAAAWALHPWSTDTPVPSSTTATAPSGQITTAAPPTPTTTATTPASTPTAAALPPYPPPNSGCTGSVVGHYDFDHPNLGPMRLFLLLGEKRVAMDSGCVSAAMPSGAALPPIPVDAGLGLEVADPATDGTGNLFIRFRSLSAHAPPQVLVLVPTAYGFRELGRDSLDIELVGPGADGDYMLRHSMNDCTPSCAEGTWTEELLRWNGSDYVP